MKNGVAQAQRRSNPIAGFECLHPVNPVNPVKTSGRLYRRSSAFIGGFKLSGRSFASFRVLRGLNLRDAIRFADGRVVEGGADAPAEEGDAEEDEDYLGGAGLVQRQ